MWWIVGLGNPGERYRWTRHNAGFLAIDLAAARWSPKRPFRSVGQSLVLQAEFSEQSVLLVKPQTFMNLSGLAVQEIREQFADGDARLVVIYDDLDLPLGKIRLRERGSAGGHHGMESIIYHLGVDDFLRLRLGIAADPPSNDAIEFVLEPFSKKEVAVVEEMLDKGVQALESLMTQGAGKAMSLFN